MVGTGLTKTPWSCQDVADLAGIRVNHTTERLVRAERKLELLVDAVAEQMEDQNDVNVARAIAAATRTLGALAIGDPKGFARYVTRVIRARRMR